MSAEDNAWFDLLRVEMRRRTGVVIEIERAYAVAQRLAPAARACGLDSAAALTRKAFMEGDVRAQTAVVDALMNHETSFFRDRSPFEEFRRVILPALLESRAATRRIRIWSAACATGQEAYSLAMVLDEEARRLAGWQIEIVATDLSETALEAARSGLYNQFEVQRGLPVSQLLRYFRRDGDRWRVVEHIRSRVSFDKANLMSDFSRLGVFDVIFCRNVMIYFDAAMKQTVLGRLATVLDRDGFLMLGATETTIGLGRDLVASPHKPWLCWPRTQSDAQPRLRLVR